MPAPLTPQQIAAAKRLKVIGGGVMVGGGVVAAAGLGLTIGFTSKVNKLTADMAAVEEIDKASTLSNIGGVLIASGIAILAVGGIIHRRGSKRLEVQPTLGGVVLSGRF